MEIALPVLLGILALAAVLYPLVRRKDGTGPGRLDAAALDAEVKRYREALRAGSICERCLAANPRGSRFCAECGRALAEERPSPSPARKERA